MPNAVYEGWMARCGRKKIGRSFIHMRYFVLEQRLLAYYKEKPLDNAVPLKTLQIDGNCRVEDRGLKTHHGRKVYVLRICNKKDDHKITMSAFNIEEALLWKNKIELVIDQQQGAATIETKLDASVVEHKSGHIIETTLSSSDRDSQDSPEDEPESSRTLLRRTTIGNGPPEAVLDWTRELDSGLSNQSNGDHVSSRKHWRLIRCQNGLRIFEELTEADSLSRSCSRAMKAVGVVDATCEEIFENIMDMGWSRYEWDCSFLYGCIIEAVDGHTAVLYHRLQLNWFPMFVWPRDLCYVRYWRRNDDGSYVVLFRSREHTDCGPQPGFVRAHIESGGFTISPLKPRNGRPRARVQHLMQIDLKGWGLGYISSYQQHCLLQMLNSVAGLREWLSQRDDSHRVPRTTMSLKVPRDSASSKKDQRSRDMPLQPIYSSNHANDISKQSSLMDDDSDDDDDAESELEADTYQKKNQQADAEKCETDSKKKEEEPLNELDLSCFSGNLRRDDREKARNCWSVASGNNFRVRSKQFAYDKSKIPAGKHLMELVAVDWFTDVKRIDHVARRKGCAVQVASEKGFFSLVVNLQVPASTHYSMVFYFVTKQLVPGSLLQHFVDGDDEFRNSRLKLIPSVPKGSWIVRQSVGSTPCLLGKAVDCSYIRGPNYLEIDVDIGSSTVANGVLGLVCGVITTLVVEMAFLVQGNTYDELPEMLLGAVRVSHVELKSAVVPDLGSIG